MIKKTLFIIVSCLLLFSLSSCESPSADRIIIYNAYYTEDFGEPFVYGDLVLSLRSDGYYQVVAFSEEGKNKPVVVIPQHIDGVPIMGTGIGCSTMLGGFMGSTILSYEDIGFEYLYPNKKHLPELETNYRHFKYGSYEEYSFGKGCFEYYTTNDLCFETYCNNIENYRVYYGSMHLLGYKGSRNSIKHIVYDEYGNNRNIDMIWLIFEHDGLHMPENFYKSKDTYLGDSFVNNTTFVMNYQELLYKYSLAIKYWKQQKMEKLSFDDWLVNDYVLKVANVEFRYNLIVDGNYYINESFFDDYGRKDYYWIDYVINDKVMEPPDPYVEGYEFLGWYADEEYMIPWDFETIIDAPNEGEYISQVLYAKWKKIS